MKKIYLFLPIFFLSLFAVSCSNELDESNNVGYLRLEMNTLVSTHTRVVNDIPEGYNARTLHVEIQDASGTVVKSTENFDNDTEFKGDIILEQGSYKVVAHSANWDGSQSGVNAPYYYGESGIVTINGGHRSTVSVTCTQANVKVSVRYAKNFVENFREVQTTIRSVLEGVATQTFEMPENVTTYEKTKDGLDVVSAGSVFFPVGGLTFRVSVMNKRTTQEYVQTNSITDVNPRDHFLVTYKVADAGSMGGTHVYIDEETNDWHFDIEVPRKSGTSIVASFEEKDVWAKFAEIKGTIGTKTNDFDPTKITLQYKKKTDSEWSVVENEILSINDDNLYYKLTSLDPQTTYVCRFAYSGSEEAYSNTLEFTTEVTASLYNGSFDVWDKRGEIWYADDASHSYWDSSNPGSAGALGENYNVTTQETSFVHSGASSARLASLYINAAVITKFAAASLFTGEYEATIGTSGAKLKWGVPFTARPTSLKGYMSYSPGSITRGDQPSGVGAPAKNTPDYCQIYCALLDLTNNMRKNVDRKGNITYTPCPNYLAVDNTDMSTFPAWDGSDERVIAYGQLSQNTNDNGQWKEFNIPLTYFNTSVTPTHILIVSSSSKFGDYFYGSDNSVLYLDDFELVYGDTPTVKQ